MALFDGALMPSNDAVTGTVVDVIAGRKSAVQVFGFKLVNTSGAVAYLQMFAKPASTVVLGTTVPDGWIRLSANESLGLSLPVPITLNGTGLSFAGTTTPTGNTGAAISATMFVA